MPKYDAASASNNPEATPDESTADAMPKPDGQLASLQFTGQAIFNSEQQPFQLALEEYGRVTTLDGQTQFFLIDEAAPEEPDEEFAPGFSGYIGLQPWTANEEKKERNFVWQLKEKGLIDVMRVAVFFPDQEGGTGSVKFGGYDEIGMEDSAGDLEYVRTIDKTTWDIQCRRFQFGDSIVESEEADQMKFRIEPQL